LETLVIGITNAAAGHILLGKAMNSSTFPMEAYCTPISTGSIENLSTAAQTVVFVGSAKIVSGGLSYVLARHKTGVDKQQREQRTSWEIR